MTLIAILASQRELFIKNKKGVLLILYTFCFILFLVLGGTLFLIIEGPMVEKQQKDVLDLKSKILKMYPSVPEKALDEFLNELRTAGIRGLPSAKGTISEWKLSDGVFFSGTLLTTIGYGHVTPRSLVGRILCILYTGVGIPLTLFLLASYVERLIKVSEEYKAVLFQKFQTMHGPFSIRFIHIASVMIFIGLTCFMLPAAFFSHYEEGWGIFDGIYFCFISLTTVGLGDLVPALNAEMPYVDLYKYGATFFMFAGLTMMMFMMAICAEYQHNYNSPYEFLPVTIPAEKIPINPNSVHTYGSLLTESGKSEADEKINIIIQPPDIQR